jgi:hypothetical protein
VVRVSRASRVSRVRASRDKANRPNKARAAAGTRAIDWAGGAPVRATPRPR